MTPEEQLLMLNFLSIFKEDSDLLNYMTTIEEAKYERKKITIKQILKEFDEEMSSHIIDEVDKKSKQKMEFYVNEAGEYLKLISKIVFK